MNTVKIKRRNTLTVAHRGLSGIEAENTCAAFVAAGNRSYYGIETDIRRTADGSAPLEIAISDALYVKTEKGIYRRKLCSDCVTDGEVKRKQISYYD